MRNRKINLIRENRTESSRHSGKSNDVDAKLRDLNRVMAEMGEPPTSLEDVKMLWGIKGQGANKVSRRLPAEDDLRRM